MKWGENVGFALNCGNDGLWLGQFSLFPGDLVAHAVSTRFGGCSKEPFDGLNLAMHNGDEVSAVRKNRALLCRALGLSSRGAVTAKQAHGERVARVDLSHAGRGEAAYEDALADTDALITDCRGLPLMLFFADCTPILIVDPARKAVGVVHAGWRGTARRIAQKTIEAMGACFGTRAQDCLAGIGPSIGACCYEVGEDVKEQFAADFPKNARRILTPAGDKWMLDLWAANRICLEEIGVLPQNIDAACACTSCNSRVFFSYRADRGKTGRIAAIIALK